LDASYYSGIKNLKNIIKLNATNISNRITCIMQLWNSDEGIKNLNGLKILYIDNNPKIMNINHMNYMHQVKTVVYLMKQ
jgi:hypothetical protein